MFANLIPLYIVLGLAAASGGMLLLTYWKKASAPNDYQDIFVNTGHRSARTANFLRTTFLAALVAIYASPYAFVLSQLQRAETAITLGVLFMLCVYGYYTLKIALREWRRFWRMRDALSFEKRRKAEKAAEQRSSGLHDRSVINLPARTGTNG